MTYTPNSGGDAPRVGRKIPLDDAELRRLEVRAEPPPRRRGRGILLVLVSAIVVSLLLAGIWYYYWRPEGATTPEEAFLSWIDALNREDAEAVIECSTINFAEEAERDYEIASLKMLWLNEEHLELRVESLIVVHREMMAPSIAAELDETVQWNEGKYRIDVEDSCAIEFVVSTLQGAESDTQEGVLPFVMVGSDWYVAMMPFPGGDFEVTPV